MAFNSHCRDFFHVRLDTKQYLTQDVKELDRLDFFLFNSAFAVALDLIEGIDNSLSLKIPNQFWIDTGLGNLHESWRSDHGCQHLSKLNHLNGGVNATFDKVSERLQFIK